MEKYRLMGVFAHPDDEVFGVGGTIAHYTSLGVRVWIVVATRGEAGTIVDPELKPFKDKLAEIREKELMESAKTLGIERVILLNYRDSGMKGSKDNLHPNALINQDKGMVSREIEKIILEFLPHVVLTFEPNGVYGHPDHVYVHEVTYLAVLKTMNSVGYPKRLIYTGIPKFRIRKLHDYVRSKGLDPLRSTVFRDDGLGWEEEEINLVMKVFDSKDKKLEALKKHRTQVGTQVPYIGIIPDEDLEEWVSYEYFAVGLPQEEKKLKLSGFFDGIKGD